MKDSDPRPMPHEVLRAYRQPIDYITLLRYLPRSPVYGERYLPGVRDTLLRLLLERYGDAWGTWDRDEEMSLATRTRMGGDPATAIERMLDASDYGGREETLPLLAQAMQPRWAAWWESFRWSNRDDVWKWRDVAQCVLGKRQITWLAAQYARRVVGGNLPRDYGLAMRAIDAAERWALVPSAEHRVAARSARDEIGRRIGVWDEEDRDAEEGPGYLGAAGDAAAAAASNAEEIASRFLVGAAIGATSRALYFRGVGAWLELSVLTQQLITPTLVTSASRGLSASGVIHRATVPAAIGAIVGAGAILLARRL